jgi:hypothetical protein
VSISESLYILSGAVNLYDGVLQDQMSAKIVAVADGTPANRCCRPLPLTEVEESAVDSDENPAPSRSVSNRSEMLNDVLGASASWAYCSVAPPRCPVRKLSAQRTNSVGVV